jgi:acyl carrier protein
MEKLLKILTETRPDIDFKNAKDLMSANILDSFDLITIVGEINDTFDIYVNAGDFKPENFDSAEAMWAVIQKYQSMR